VLLNRSQLLNSPSIRLNFFHHLLVSFFPLAVAVWEEASALLRVSIFLFVWLISWLPIALPLARLLKWQPPQPISPAQKLPLVASLYALAPLVIWGIVAIEGSSFAKYGLPWNGAVLRSMGLGLAIGVVGLLALFGLEWGLGWLQWEPGATAKTDDSHKSPPAVSPVLSTIGLTLLIGLWIGLTEELIFRGFFITTLQVDFSLWSTAILVSFVFAVLHLVWEGRENVPQLPGLWLMGMVLVLARSVDGGNIGLAWGLHAGWIWTMASLDTLGLIRYTGKAYAWFTGLDDKPLAGVMGLLFLLVTAAVLWVWR
jgi:membrane protease YdiL (CAAX protease family)